MLELRRQAGIGTLQQVLLDQQRDPELATAVCAVLTHSLRRRHLPSFVDMLRNNVDSISALQIAYGLDLSALVDGR